MRICHIGTMGSIEKEGQITQIIFNECEGEHIYHYLHDSARPDADVYILHCVKNQKHFPKQITYRAPFGKKLISLVHSSEPCLPSKYSDTVVTLTNAWRKRLYNLYGIDSITIYGGIDLSLYKANPNYRGNMIGRIARAEPGKFHSDWNKLLKSFLKKDKTIKVKIICKGYSQFNFIIDDNFSWVNDIAIGDHDRKIKELEEMSLYIECHNDGSRAFIETFCVATLEAMACGLPVVIYKGMQEPLAEVVGNGGVVCDDIDVFKNEVLELIKNPVRKKQLGEKARKRAEQFSKENMIYEWNQVLGEICSQ